MLRVVSEPKFIVATAKILHERMPGTNHPYGSQPTACAVPGEELQPDHLDSIYGTIIEGFANVAADPPRRFPDVAMWTSARPGTVSLMEDKRNQPWLAL